MDYNSLGHQTIPHYYGDTVRGLFIGAVVLGLLGIPVVGNLLPLSVGFDIIAGIILIALAGLINPHSKLVMGMSVIASSFAAFLFQYAAVTLSSTDPLLLSVGRQVEAIVFVTALYFSIKTLRAMTQNKTGEVEPPWEFEDEHKKV
jgi:hypothetical protein